jgi:ureidoacrylate peracid hydrolase
MRSVDQDENLASSGRVSVDARPEDVSFVPSQSAVLVVDMQNDFGAAGGMFARAGLPIEGIKNVVWPIGRVVSAARAAGVLIVYLQMEFNEDLSDAGGQEAPNFIKHRQLGVGDEVTTPDGQSSRILIADTWNTQILPELMPEPGDVVVSKHRYSGFFETDLDRLLRERGIDTLIVTGCTTSVCVESTIRDAFYRDYRCVLLADCTAEPLGSDASRTNYDASLLTIEALFGWISDSSALLNALEETTAIRG